MCCLLAAAVLALIGAWRWLSTLVGKSGEAAPRVALLALLVAGIAETVAVGERLVELRDAGGGKVAGLPLCSAVLPLKGEGRAPVAEGDWEDGVTAVRRQAAGLRANDTDASRAFNPGWEAGLAYVQLWSPHPPVRWRERGPSFPFQGKDHFEVARYAVSPSAK